MYRVYEVFGDGKKFTMFESDDHFTCEVWASNHDDCTTALRNRVSHLEIIELED